MAILETYHESDLNGELITLDIHSTGKIVLGTRFDSLVTIRNVSVSNFGSVRNEAISTALNFFKNFAVLLSANDLNKGWQMYKKALKSRIADTNTAFWQYFDGYTPRPVGRKWQVIEWVKC